MVASNRFLVAQDERRSKASASRYTRDGRFLTYELEIFQQPRHARACGAGAKCKSHSTFNQPFLDVHPNCMGTDMPFSALQPPQTVVPWILPRSSG